MTPEANTGHNEAGPTMFTEAQDFVPLRGLLAGMLLGVVAGGLANLLWGGRAELLWVVDGIAQPLGHLFLRLIFMVVIPLLLSALTLGVLGLGDLRALGKVGLRTLAVTLLISSLAALTGVVLVNVFRPGEGMAEEVRASLWQSLGQAQSAVSAADTTPGLGALFRVVPDNPVRAAAQGDMLAVMVFALVFGIGLTRAAADRVETLRAFLEGLYEVTMAIVAMAMRLAPYGVACLLFSLTARSGFGVLRQLAAYVGVVVLGLAFHQLITYGLILRLGARVSPTGFFRAAAPVLVTAFATSSSNATLPLTLRVANERLGIPRDIGNFVLTLGSTANQNGTALFEGVTVLFLAQFFGVSLSWANQLLVVFMAVLAGVGTAGVPGGSLPMIVPVLVAVGVPAEGIGVILGVDRLLDMCRTVLNVSGDLTAAAVVSAWEGRLSFPPPAVHGATGHATDAMRQGGAVLYERTEEKSHG